MATSAMTPAEEALCRGVFARQRQTQVTPVTSYAFLLELTEALVDHGSEDHEGKAVAFLFFIIMRAAQGQAATNNGAKRR